VTAVAAALILGQRARLGFWACAVAGSVLVVVFAWLRADQAGGFGLARADWLLLGAVVAASVGYVYGAQVTPELGAERVICWMCVLTLPFSLPATLYLWPDTAAQPCAPAPGWVLPTSARCRCGRASSRGFAGWTGAARCA
jgi:drug/metabolite transporter (DMT)-like permease